MPVRWQYRKTDNASSSRWSMARKERVLSDWAR